MKRLLSFVCVGLLAISSSGAASAATFAQWNATAGTPSEDLAKAPVGTQGTNIGDVNNFISDSSSAINNANYGPGIVGSLNFINQLEVVGGAIPPPNPDPGDWKQFRLRNGNKLNPESNGDDIYTQLYWADAAVIQSLAAGTEWTFDFSNNVDEATVRAAVRDTNGDWFLSGSSTVDTDLIDNTDFVTYALDLGLETWAAYTPATATTTSLLLAPTTGFTATPGPIDAYGFFLQDTDTNFGSQDGRWRIDGFTVTGTVVPEPSSLALCSLVSLGLISRRRRKQ